MALKIKLHPETPHVKRVFEIVDQLRKDQVALLPTDSGYALACRPDARKAIERIKQIRNLSDTHHFTLLTSDLSKISDLGYMDNDQFKLIKRIIPASVTFILKASKVIPKLLVNPKKNTIGIRVPDHKISQGIIAELGEPLFVTTAKLPDGDYPEVLQSDDFIRAFEKHVDLIVDDEQEVRFEPSTIIDLSEDRAKILREGKDYQACMDALANSQLDIENIE